MPNQIILSLLVGALLGFVVRALELPKEIRAFIALSLVAAVAVFLLKEFGINIFI